MENEKRATEFYLRHSRLPGKAERLLTEESEFKNLLSPYFQSISEELSNWKTEEYEHNTMYPEQLVHTSGSGNKVRSKSEFMIDMYLYTNMIPFRYECPLRFGETTIYPDFTIRHPKTGEFYYWEHFGLMDNPNYVKNAYSKMQLYTNHGIIPTVNLITTYETREHPLTYETIEKVVHDYFF